MHRLTRWEVVGLIALGLGCSVSEAVAQKGQPPSEGKAKLRVVVHVNFEDGERQGHGLRNVRNLLQDAKEGVEVEVVSHGGGISLLVKGKTRHAEEVAKLIKQGVRFAACENAMREKAIARDQLLSNAVTVSSGIGEVIRKQRKGYGYFKS